MKQKCLYVAYKAVKYKRQPMKFGCKSKAVHQQQSGAVEACWAHNPEVRGSKPRSASFLFFYFTHLITDFASNFLEANINISQERGYLLRHSELYKPKVAENAQMHVSTKMYCNYKYSYKTILRLKNVIIFKRIARSVITIMMSFGFSACKIGH